MVYDVIIIGAGVSGCAAARELSRYEAQVCVLDKEEDVCCGTSKANSAIIHAGYDCTPGTQMARFNILGNEMMDRLTAAFRSFMIRGRLTESKECGSFRVRRR